MFSKISLTPITLPPPKKNCLCYYPHTLRDSVSPVCGALAWIGIDFIGAALTLEMDFMGALVYLTNNFSFKQEVRKKNNVVQKLKLPIKIGAISFIPDSKFSFEAQNLQLQLGFKFRLVDHLKLDLVLIGWNH